MASSKTVFRPLWVRAEHSRYFTESGGEGVGKRARPELGGFRADTPNQGQSQEGLPEAESPDQGICLMGPQFPLPGVGSWDSQGVPMSLGQEPPVSGRQAGQERP